MIVPQNSLGNVRAKLPITQQKYVTRMAILIDPPTFLVEFTISEGTNGLGSVTTYHRRIRILKLKSTTKTCKVAKSLVRRYPDLLGRDKVPFKHVLKLISKVIENATKYRERISSPPTDDRETVSDGIQDQYDGKYEATESLNRDVPTGRLGGNAGIPKDVLRRSESGAKPECSSDRPADKSGTVDLRMPTRGTDSSTAENDEKTPHVLKEGIQDGGKEASNYTFNSARRATSNEGANIKSRSRLLLRKNELDYTSGSTNSSNLDVAQNHDNQYSTNEPAISCESLEAIPGSYGVRRDVDALNSCGQSKIHGDVAEISGAILHFDTPRQAMQDNDTCASLNIASEASFQQVEKRDSVHESPASLSNRLPSPYCANIESNTSAEMMSLNRAKVHHDRYIEHFDNQCKKKLKGDEDTWQKNEYDVCARNKQLEERHFTNESLGSVDKHTMTPLDGEDAHFNSCATKRLNEDESIRESLGSLDVHPLQSQNHFTMDLEKPSDELPNQVHVQNPHSGENLAEEKWSNKSMQGHVYVVNGHCDVENPKQSPSKQMPKTTGLPIDKSSLRPVMTEKVWEPGVQNEINTSVSNGEETVGSWEQNDSSSMVLCEKGGANESVNAKESFPSMADLCDVKRGEDLIIRSNSPQQADVKCDSDPPRVGAERCLNNSGRPGMPKQKASHQFAGLPYPHEKFSASEQRTTQNIAVNCHEAPCKEDSSKNETSTQDDASDHYSDDPLFDEENSELITSCSLEEEIAESLVTSDNLSFGWSTSSQSNMSHMQEGNAYRHSLQSSDHSANTDVFYSDKGGEENSERAKLRTDENFERNMLKPGDEGFEFDKRADFDKPEVDSSWD